MKCPKCSNSGLNCSLCGGSGYVDSNQESVRQYLGWKEGNKGGGTGCLILLIGIFTTGLTAAYGLCCS